MLLPLIRAPTVLALHTFRGSFEPTANPKHGRPASVAERPFVIPSMFYLYVDFSEYHVSTPYVLL